MRGGYQSGERPADAGPQPKPAAFTRGAVSANDYYGRHAQPPLPGWRVGMVYYRHLLQRFERVELIHLGPDAITWVHGQPLEDI